MTIPDSALIDAFMPSPAYPAFQRNEIYHCFSFDSSTGKPNYVRGTAQGYWYFEGPVNDGSVSVLGIYSNQLEFDNNPIVGTLSLQYASDYMSADIISVSCQPSSLCNDWPSSLENGVDGSSVDTISYCLYDPTSTPGTVTDLLSKWTSAQGTTWMCSFPNAMNPNAVNGSWLYENDAEECASRGESYPCPANQGPYKNGISVTLPSEKGMIVTQWYGWNFNASSNHGYADGRSIFAAVSSTYSSGAYCVYDNAKGKIQYCYPEAYNIVGAANDAECLSLDNAPTLTPTASPTPSQMMPTHKDGLSGGDWSGIIIAIVVAVAVVTIGIFRGRRIRRRRNDEYGQQVVQSGFVQLNP